MARKLEASVSEKKFPRLEALLELQQRYGARREEDDLAKVAPGTMRALLWVGAPALLGLIVYAIDSSVLAMSLLTGAASFAVGALLGFLFGIPRTIANQHAVGGSQDGDAPIDPAAPAFAPNTNLEQISDWLTKILVGVGLVQLGQIGSGIDRIADELQPGLGTNGHAVAVALMISFSISGFLAAYIFTRLRLQSAFTLAALFKAVKEQTDADPKAIALVKNQLDPGGEGEVTVAALASALEKATSGTRAQAFFLAREQRRANWKGGDPELVALTIPVFEALIATDDARRYHRNYAELGFSLKDKGESTAADLEKARDNLTKAIDIRGPEGVVHFPMYEFNRAICNIRLDPGFHKNEPSSPELAKNIEADLQAAERTQAGLAAIGESDPVKVWRNLNRTPPAPGAVAD